MVASVGRMVVASVGITLGRGLNSRTSLDDVSVPSPHASSQAWTAWRSSSASSCVAAAVVMVDDSALAATAVAAVGWWRADSSPASGLQLG